MCQYAARPGQAGTEVWFRIVHMAGNGRDGAQVTANREQIVQISLGLKGTFENNAIGAFTRQVQLPGL